MILISNKEPTKGKNVKSITKVKSIPESVNFHFIKACNMKCTYCFASFKDLIDTNVLKSYQQKEIVKKLAKCFIKITFVGGEPFLSKNLINLAQIAKVHDMITCVVTNGFFLEPSKISKLPFDWITISIDSAIPEIHWQLGRTHKGVPMPIERYLQISDAVHNAGKHFKINTVVNSLNVNEDMSEFILKLGPSRWKLFQVLPIMGENDEHFASLRISAEQFNSFVERHKTALDGSGISIIPENNSLMTGSYAMVDPEGRFFDNVNGFQKYSSSILEVGVEKAWKDIVFDRKKFEARGGDDYFKI